MNINKRYDRFSAVMLYRCMLLLSKEKEKMWASTSWLDCCW